MLDFKKYEKDGKVAVLYSPGFGAGWSTWNRPYDDFFLFDSKLIEMALREALYEEVDRYLDEVFGEDFCYYLGG